MRILMALDWSEETFAAVREAGSLYDIREAILVHAIDLGMFQSPLVADISNLQGYSEFRASMEQAGRQLLDHTATLLPSGNVSVTRVCEFAKPAALIVDQARERDVDLIVVGAGGKGRLGELVLGSVSHRVALHATCPTLIVRECEGPVKKVVVAVESHEDGGRIKTWLLAHPFKQAVHLTIVSVVRAIPTTDPFNIFPVQDWTTAALRTAKEVVTALAADLAGQPHTIDTEVTVGDLLSVLTGWAKQSDLLVIGSHGRHGLERFLLGSISHALLHASPCSVLIVR